MYFLIISLPFLDIYYILTIKLYNNKIMRPYASNKKEILFLIDEAHRSQYSCYML